MLGAHCSLVFVLIRSTEPCGFHSCIRFAVPGYPATEFRNRKNRRWIQNRSETCGCHIGEWHRLPTECNLLWSRYRVHRENQEESVPARDSHGLSALEGWIGFHQSLLNRLVLSDGVSVRTESAVRPPGASFQNLERRRPVPQQGLTSLPTVSRQ